MAEEDIFIFACSQFHTNYPWKSRAKHGRENPLAVVFMLWIVGKKISALSFKCLLKPWAPRRYFTNRLIGRSITTSDGYELTEKK